MKQTKICFKSPSAILPPKDLKGAITQLIVASRLPFSIVSEPAFKQLLEMARAASKLDIPHRTTISGPELNNLHAEVLNSIKNQFNDVNHISLTVDGTTSLSGVPYWSVTVAGLGCFVFDAHGNLSMRSSLLRTLGREAILHSPRCS